MDEHANNGHSDANDDLPRLPATRANGSTCATRELAQAYDLRDLMHKEAMALNDAPLGEKETRSSRAQAQAGVVKAWRETVVMLRVIRGAPSPGTLSPAERQARQKRKSKRQSDDGPLGSA